MLPPSSDSIVYAYNYVGSLVWQDSTQDLKAITRPSLNTQNSPPHAVFAQKDIHVDAGKPYTLNVHVKELGPDKQYGVVFVFRKQEILSNGFGVFNSQYALLGQQQFTDTGTYTLQLLDNQSEDITVITGYISNATSYMILDDVSLSTYAEQTYLTQTFDDSITPWRSSVFTEEDNPPMVAGTAVWEADSQRLKITQGDFEMQGMQLWLGAAARQLPTQSYTQYALNIDVLNSTVSPIDFANVPNASIGIYDANEFNLVGPIGAQPIIDIPINAFGTISSPTFRSRGGNVVVLVHIMGDKTQQANAGVFYLDNLTLNLVQNSVTYTCEASTPNTQISTGTYRYGFNGQEKDDEVRGNGNALEFGGRSIYDPRLGRFISVDPLGVNYPYLSGYNFANNTPIWAIDYYGFGWIVYTWWDVKKVIGKNKDLSYTFNKMKFDNGKIMSQSKYTNGFEGTIFKNHYLYNNTIYSEPGQIPGYSNWIKSEYDRQQRIVRDGLLIIGGITVTIATLGTGTPEYMILAGTISGMSAIAGGGTKLGLELQNSPGNKEIAETIPDGPVDLIVGVTLEGMVDKKNVKLRKEIRLITNIADGIIDLSGLAQKITSIPDAVDKTIVAIDVVIQVNERCDDINDISKE